MPWTDRITSFSSSLWMMTSGKLPVDFTIRSKCLKSHSTATDLEWWWIVSWITNVKCMQVHVVCRSRWFCVTYSEQNEVLHPHPHPFLISSSPFFCTFRNQDLHSQFQTCMPFSVRSLSGWLLEVIHSSDLFRTWRIHFDGNSSRVMHAV